jgi:hypothetical protein
MMVVEEVAEALTADFEAQMGLAGNNSRSLWQRLDERDHPPAPAFEDRLGCTRTRREKSFFH